MRFLGALVAWILLFLLFLALRFPYRTAFERTVARIETATGADLAWEQADVGLLGVELQGFTVRMPSGARFGADRAHFRPAWGGLTATFTQTQQKGAATARLNGSDLALHAEDLQVETGSRDLATVRITGDLGYNLNSREGRGEMRMKVPDLSKVLPVPVPSLEIGAKVAIKPMALPAGPGPGPAGAPPAMGTEVTSDVSLFGEGLSGGGNLSLRSTPGGGPPALAGTLQLNAGNLGNHTIRVGGTWGRPEWNLAQGANP